MTKNDLDVQDPRRIVAVCVCLIFNVTEITYLRTGLSTPAAHEG